MKKLGNKPKPVVKKTTTTQAQQQSSDTGAAAALRRWEDQEKHEALEVKKAESALENAKRKRDDDLIRKTESDLESCKERWAQTSKLLLSFERGVAPEKREGEKMLVSEIERLLENCWRADRLALEAFGLSIAQDGIRCSSEQEFYKRFQDNFRQTRESALRSGIDNLLFPKWVMAAFENSL